MLCLLLLSLSQTGSCGWKFWKYSSHGLQINWNTQRKSEVSRNNRGEVETQEAKIIGEVGFNEKWYWH